MDPRNITQYTTLEKVPPHNLEAEMAVLGSMLLDKEAVDKAAEKVTSDTFYHLPHKTVFSTMLDMYKSNRVVDLATLTDRLKNLGKLDSIGGAVYLTELVDAVPTTAHIDSYLKIIADCAMRRNLIATCTKIVQRSYEGQEEADELLDQAETEIFDIAEKKVTESFHLIDKLVMEAIDKIEKLSEDKHYVTGVPSGFHDLDELTSGFQRSDTIVLASRPSMGKTSLALTIAEYIAFETQIPVAIFSLEMSKEQVTQRMICSRAWDYSDDKHKVDAHAIRKGYVSDEVWDFIVKAASDLTNSKIYINDTPGLNSLQLRAIARRLKSTYDIQFLIIDYLQLMQGSAKKYDNRQQEISDISRSIKALARELNIPILVCSQLNRDVENRSDKRPQLSDLRESGAIEQDADVVLLMVRQEYYDETVKPGIADIIVAKQRNGPTGNVELVFLSECTRFVPLTRREEVQEPEEEEVDF